MLSGVTVDRDIVAPEEAFLVYEGSNTNTGSRRRIQINNCLQVSSRHDFHSFQTMCRRLQMNLTN